MFRLHPALQRVLDAHGTFFTDHARDRALGAARLQQLLAARFDYHVRKGGFAQLLFNSRGDLLRETEEMLSALGATRGQDHYVRAIQLAFSDVERWKRFLASDYVSENELKPLLTEVSLAYFRGGPSFEEEIAAPLARWSTEAGPPPPSSAPPNGVAFAPATKPASSAKSIGCVVAILIAVSLIFGIPVYRFLTGAMDSRPRPAAMP